MPNLEEYDEIENRIKEIVIQLLIKEGRENPEVIVEYMSNRERVRYIEKFTGTIHKGLLR